ncbi:MAG: F0F1 ATP synthase subunit B, partial [Staphylococcus hominis]
MTPISVLAAGETANPLLPATYDIIWSAVSFAIIFFAFWK